MADMTRQDYQNLADLTRRVIERAKALPDLNQLTPQEAIVAVLEMAEQEYRAADQIMPTTG